MAGMNPERKTQDAIEQANRKMLQEHDKRLEKWRKSRLNFIERDRETIYRNETSATAHD
ncbi:hypothetical protein NKH34_29770 [Mesorhizobium sp. M1148]|uniref:hypothetical protein n=1 Tax=unclassified Mesorhizobium TaxID=325217 RepID=UPI0012EBFC3B|nr:MULTISPECIES: hypothetical protein [unclassified Mesorhizobium]WJI76982.1 hypothetical protein NLY37_09920 [Mesorhizobium sp. C395A]